ncbi:MAG TPA: MFS transporter [Vicinamibacterales bacterium]|nr:MFS transporter [Vicinamibacterales bacterium]
MDRSEAAPIPATALSPFRYPIFRAVWVANVLASLGTFIESVGASWLMLSIAPSADMVALVQASIALPTMLLSLAAGALADNYDRRRVMLGADFFMLAVSITLAVCAWTGAITPWFLLLLTFLLGCGSAFSGPAWQAAVGDMVPRKELPGAVTLNSVAFNIARSVGPAIGGAIVAAAGAAVAFTVNAVCYIPMIGVLARWRSPERSQALPREPLGVAIAAGIRYVWMSPAILSVLLRSLVFGIGASGLMALMPLVAKVLLGGGPLVYGLMLGAFGVGAVGGAVSSSKLRGALSTETIVRWACVVSSFATAIAAVSNWLPITMAGLVLAGAGWVLALTTFNVSVQLNAPRWVVARALSIYQMAAFGGIAGGSWIWGVVASQGGVTPSLLMCAIVLLGCAALGTLQPLEQSRALDLGPLRQWQEPETAVAVNSRTGPVVITIEYLIREADQLRFLAAMSERRRIRRRDGALNWRLLRDLANPELWIERYETPTWLEYLRLNSRMTQNDADIPESLRALHQGAGPPQVRRMIERPAVRPDAD